MKIKLLLGVMMGCVSVCSASTLSNATSVNNTAAQNIDHPISLEKYERKGSILPLTDVTKPVVVSAGKEQFVIVLKSYPSTGYRWDLTAYDHRVVASAFKTYVPTSNLVGGGGQEQWYFNLATPRNSGHKQMTMTFEYRRPWDKPEVKHQVMNLKVIIANHSS